MLVRVLVWACTSSSTRKIMEAEAEKSYLQKFWGGAGRLRYPPIGEEGRKTQKRGLRSLLQVRESVFSSPLGSPAASPQNSPRTAQRGCLESS